MRLSLSSFSRHGALIAAVAVVFGLAASIAEARPGGGRSAGSRGDKTFSAPPSTNTAPGAKSMERTMQQPGKANPAAAGQAAGAATQAAKPSMMRNLLLGGLIGAGLATLLGTGTLASVLGFVLQAALIAGVVLLIVAFFRSRRSAQPAMATAAAGSGPVQQNASYRQMPAGLGASEPTVTIGPDDYTSFERLLGEIQTAYGRNDVKALETRATPEMLSYFAEELSENSKKGVRNEISGVKLLQGDLAEAWSESSGEYATVAMRYAIVDVTLDASTGRVVSGDRNAPEEVTEVWTFWRPRNGNPSQWELSAIQQGS